MKFNIKNIAIALTAIAATGCTDIDIQPDGRIDFEEIWQHDRMVAGYLNNCYYEMIGRGEGAIYGDGHSFLDSFTDNAQDVDDATGGKASLWNNGAVTPFNNPLTKLDMWQTYYSAIRRCNIFINRIDEPETVVIIPSNRVRYKGEAHGLRAYYYLQLIKAYGGVPIILSQRDDKQIDYTQAQPATFNQVVRQILSDCREVLDNDQITYRSGTDDKDIRRVNKAFAYAIMSEAVLYATSPLNFDGTITKQEAAEITKEALDQCLANGYRLFTTKPSTNVDQMLARGAYDNMFLKSPDVTGATDPEAIYYNNQCNVWQYNTAPIIAGHIRAGSCPTQELVDAYETTDGKPVLNLDKPYLDEQHLQPNYNADNTLYDPKNPYANRDPRLQGTIYYNTAHAHILESVPVPTIYTGEGAKHEISATSLTQTRTGYYIHKYFNITSNRTTFADGYFRVFRLAELYLNYAEAACEAAEGGNIPTEAYNAVNAVRSRAGMPALPSGLTQEQFRARVRNERRVEFAFEDHRFFDVRRWKTLDQSKYVTGMRPIEEIKEIEETDGEGNVTKTEERIVKDYERFVVSTRKATSDKYLRIPVPGAEVQRLKQATGKDFQNDSWK